MTYEQSIKFDFPDLNNQAEYEALISSLTLAKEVGVTKLEVNSDSQVVTSQRQVIARSRIPEIDVPDKGMQFSDEKFREFLTGLGIKQKLSFVEHPQSNGQAEATNKVILSGLKKCLDQQKGFWADKLASVLWSYRTTPQSFTEETPF
ncbi:uncharacterized protein LOC130974902 [Arachis stenosperma]|uniref:uncharacterized protein LOC130974902 n=1 Tax=Arachis stenosperma TaxID=217475 RepID=UPI0025AD9383|nr:uncharacterized protein LOC130974902 [Arachis stenosperma]